MLDTTTAQIMYVPFCPSPFVPEGKVSHYEFDGVVKGHSVSANFRGITLGSDASNENRVAVAWFHTHGPYTQINGQNDLAWDLFTDWTVQNNLNYGDAWYSNYLGLNAYLSNPAGQLKYFDRTQYKSQMGNTHVSEPNKAVSVFANYLPIIN